MMDERTATDIAKGMLHDGKLPDVAAANVYIVKLMGVRVIAGSLPREVRSALMAAVKAGEIGRVPKKGLGPEIFHHKNARGTAIATQERIFREGVEAPAKGVCVMNAATRRLIAAMPASTSLSLSPEHMATLHQLIEWERVEIASSYVDSRHFYLENLGYIRRTTRDVDHHRYGKVPTAFYIPTPKGREIAVAVERSSSES